MAPFSHRHEVGWPPQAGDASRGLGSSAGIGEVGQSRAPDLRLECGLEGSVFGFGHGKELSNGLDRYIGVEGFAGERDDG